VKIYFHTHFEKIKILKNKQISNIYSREEIQVHPKRQHQKNAFRGQADVNKI